MAGTRGRFVAGIAVLTFAHHVDHAARRVTGWPLTPEVNAFTVSLLVYPAIAAGLVLTRRGRAGRRFWAVLAGGGALFVLLVHVGPAAGDLVTRIPGQHDSTVADVAALVVLAALLVALVGHCAYEARTPEPPDRHRGARA
jgi:hypothetical protein